MPTRHSIHLTMEEALGLLDLLLVCPGDFSGPQEQAMAKLTAFCRQGLQETEETGIQRDAALVERFSY